MDIKRILKWGGSIILVWIVLFLANTLYIRDWLIKYSEQKVQKNILKNYEDKKEHFKTLIEYVRKLNMVSNAEIEFVNNNKINSYLTSSFVSDSIQINSISYNLNLLNIETENMWHAEFEFLPDGKVKISYGDTIIETSNWHWNFEGAPDNPQFEKFINYIGISKRELETLRRLIKESLQKPPPPCRSNPAFRAREASSCPSTFPKTTPCRLFCACFWGRAEPKIVKPGHSQNRCADLEKVA